ncbi:MAG TPA: AmmeMemoRadiSam system protein B [Acidimicrobiales bacterium]
MAAGGSAGWVRTPAVAGLFYPAEPDELRAAVAGHVAAGPPPAAASLPKALIAPHAGYRYSGATAGAAYRTVAALRGRVTRVVLAGPAHRVPVDGGGVGVSTAGAWRTPLGDVRVDVDACRALVAGGMAVEADEAHAPEHSLEVHLPFLQVVLGRVAVVPLVVGRCPPGSVAVVLDAVWGGEETLVVVSTDLSHYLDDTTARRRDRHTRHAILEGRVDDIGPYDACGCVPVGGLLLAARDHGIAPRTLAVATSADAAGDPARVVGYGSFGFDVPRPLVAGERRWLLRRARAAIVVELATGEPDPLGDDDVPERLRLPGASFVTLEHGGELSGCIGSLEARRPLWQDVARNARAAAFADPRFGPLEAGMLDRTVITVSVLSGLDPLPGSHDDLVTALRPGVDGVLLEAGGHRGTFLPTVWDKLPGAEEFVDHLVGKAGLPDRGWPDDAQAWRYTTDEFADADAG